MKAHYNQQIPVSILRQTMLVMVFCFLPHLTTAPWWISVLAILAIFYRLIAENRDYLMLPWWLKGLMAVTGIALLRWEYNTFIGVEIFVGILLTLFWLKIIEVYSFRDIKTIIIINFYVMFAALITNINAWIFAYIVLGVLANVMLLLKLELPSVRVKQLSLNSIKLLAIAFPVALLLFFLFPRLGSPLWGVNLPTEGNTGFTEQVSPGMLSGLNKDSRTAMRITFKNKKPEPNLYWYGLTLSHYDGLTWKELPRRYDGFLPIRLLSYKEQADYEVILEPHNKRWLFYLRNPVAALPYLKFSENSGLTGLHEKSVIQRFRYAVNSQPPAYHPLNPSIRQQNLQLPVKANPRLRAWAIMERRPFGNDTRAFVKYLLGYIHQEPYWYKLKPKPIGTRDDQLDRFWFITREGYCEHYASAMAFILRASGIPARVIIGYFGGEWNPLGNFLNVRQQDVHTWVEYWQPEAGWILADPSAAIAASRIDNEIQAEQTRHLAFYSDWSKYSLTLSWFTKARLAYEYTRFFWEKWILFYNQEQQQSLIKALGLENLKTSALFQLWIVSLFLFLFAGWLYYYFRERKLDPLKKEYDRLQKEMSRLHVKTKPPATLFRQWHDLAQKQPQMSDLLYECTMEYEKLRLKGNDNPENKNVVRLLFKSLRKQLQKLPHH